MKSTINTPLGRVRFQGQRVQARVDRYPNRGDVEANLNSRGSHTEVYSHWGETDYVSGSLNVHDSDSKANLKLEFHRRNGAGTLMIKNPGRKGEGSSISLPVGDVSRTRDGFFSKGFFPASGVSHVRVGIEKEDGGQYTTLEFSHGEDTITHLYRVEEGVIYELPSDAGFSGYYDYHGKR